MELLLKAQNQILADLRARVRDNAADRWTDAECYGAINDALLTWQDRVRVPHLYTITGGWVAGTLEYTLPDWIRSNAIQPQMKMPQQFTAASAYRLLTETWQDIPGWRIEPNASNQRVLKFSVSPYSAEGRLIWWGSNMPLPISPVTLNDPLATADTVIEISGEVDCAEYGWLKIGSEWMQYSGVDRSQPGLGINNLVRGLSQGAEAYDHNDGESIYFGVAMPKAELYRVLINQAIVHLHELYLGNASGRETQLHQEMIGYYTGLVQQFWKNWSDIRSVKQQIDSSTWVNM